MAKLLKSSKQLHTILFFILVLIPFAIALIFSFTAKQTQLFYFLYCGIYLVVGLIVRKWQPKLFMTLLKAAGIMLIFGLGSLF